MKYPDLKPEQAELLRIMKAYVISEPDYKLPPSFSFFAELFSLSLKQRVAPIVWHYLSSDPEAIRKCPKDTAKFWKAQADSESVVQDRRESGFLEMYQVLREGGLHPLVLKGAVCRHLYAFPALRVSCDEDVFIQKDEFEEFDILIRACGFIQDETENISASYTEPESGTHVEAHLELFPIQNSFNRRSNAEFCDAFSRAAELDISGTKVLTLEPTENLLFLILHHLKHFCSKGAGIRMLCDIIAFTETYAGQIDRERISGKLRDFGLERYFGALEAIGHRYLGLSEKNVIFPEVESSDVDISDMLDDMFAAGVFGTVSQTRIQSSHITYAALDTGKEQGPVFKNLFFPSSGKMHANYKWTRGRAILLPAAYAVRAFNAVSRAVRYRRHRSDKDPGRDWIALGKRRVDMLRKYGILAAVSAGAAETNYMEKESFR